MHKLFKVKTNLSNMKIVFTPNWFLHGDVAIEIFSFIILAIFFLLCLRSYKIGKNKNTLFLGIGFLIIAVAELSIIFTKAVLYYDTILIQQIGQMIVTYNVAKSVDIFYYLGFFVHRLFTLIGLYVIYRLPMKKGKISDYLLAIYFIALSALFSFMGAYYLFHLTALLLLAMIINNYLKVYNENKSHNTKILIIAFLMLALSQIIFILSKLNIAYAIAQIIQLVSYIILLVLIINILENGKKTDPDRDNSRYAVNSSRKRQS